MSGDLSQNQIQAEIHAAVLFQVLACCTPRQLRHLLEITTSFSNALELVQQPLSKNIRFSPEQENRIKQFRSNPAPWKEKTSQLINLLSEQKAEIIPLTSSEYPLLLKEAGSPPPVLFVEGNANLIHLPQLAIVGSRRASKAGLQLAENFARDLAAGGMVITSGMALGVDGAAHRGALHSGTGNTIACLGTGLDVTYPRKHAQLRDEILDQGGALVTEFLPGTQAIARHFPQRNRIISGLSMGVLVVEAAIKSGSLITARYALSQGREVFAIPGSIHNPLSRGGHQLIREGAALVESVDDIIEQLGGLLALKGQEASDTDSSVSFAKLDDMQQHLLEIVGFNPVAIDELIAQSGCTAAEVNSNLLALELAGMIDNQQGRIIRLR